MRGWGVVACAIVFSAIDARGEPSVTPEPEPQPAQPDDASSNDTEVPDQTPAPQPRASPLFGGKPSPAGRWIDVGLSFSTEEDSEATLRIIAGWPDLFPVSDGRLGVAVPVYYDSINIFDIRAYFLAVIPGVDWEYEFFNNKGRLSLSLQGGLGFATLWVERPDEPFMPGGWDSDTALLVRGAALLRYGLPMGIHFQFQPLGILGGFNDGNSGFDVELGLAVGYRWW